MIRKWLAAVRNSRLDACPGCWSGLAAADFDAATGLPWYRCRCGFAGSMIHAAARTGATDLATAAGRLFGRGRTATAIGVAELRADEVRRWWERVSRVPLADVDRDDWPGGRGPFLESLGLTDAPPVLSALTGRLVVTRRWAVPTPGSTVKTGLWSAACLKLDTCPGRTVGLRVFDRGRWRDHTAYAVDAAELTSGLTPGDRPTVITADLAEYLRAVGGGRLAGWAADPLRAWPRYGRAANASNDLAACLNCSVHAFDVGGYDGLARVTDRP